MSYYVVGYDISMMKENKSPRKKRLDGSVEYTEAYFKKQGTLHASYDMSDM